MFLGLVMFCFFFDFVKKKKKQIKIILLELFLIAEFISF